ncbi:unnamed protein product [Cuscuta europaea]|uniref:Endonuclease/exonuclease/phosphatase domain-containing protein n=1 Tax=Cuscuta europaea TaxID=41803 RepID=A0A9P0ZBD5_CUSEU|nr:unnamed protein product [Cuscuta europaea]
MQVNLEDGVPGCRFTGFYGCPERSRRRETWNILKSLSLGSDKPWLVMGDFNDIMFASRKERSCSSPSLAFEGFSGNCVDEWSEELFLQRISIHLGTLERVSELGRGKTCQNFGF